MIRRKNFENPQPTLYLVATPIGNLAELTPRAIEILKKVNLIACEDTRTSGTLLSYFAIKTKTVTYHNFNEEESAAGLLALLKEHKDIALISDAGYPLISDPGYLLVREAVHAGYNVTCISGSNAALNALVASGMAANHFLFYGFLNEKRSKAAKELTALKDFPYTMIFYEAPHRIKTTLAAMREIFGDRQAVIARELTKLHEEFIHGSLAEMLTLTDLKGEIVIIVAGSKEKKEASALLVKEKITELLTAGFSEKDAIKACATFYCLPKNKIYRIYQSLK